MNRFLVATLLLRIYRGDVFVRCADGVANATNDGSYADEELGGEPCTAYSGEIVGGQATSIRRHPYQASFVVNGNTFCGGFIVSADYVMTAAHCVRRAVPARVRLRVGSTFRDAGGRIVPVARITVHERYDTPPFDNDIAVMRLARPLAFGPRVAAVALPARGQAVPDAFLTVTGWGLTMGDSGGPAVVGSVVFGIVSYARGCAQPLAPTVFTNVAAQRDWITANTGL